MLNRGVFFAMNMGREEPTKAEVEDGVQSSSQSTRQESA
jgi:hypothetical protein